MLYKDKNRKRKSARLPFLFANKEIFPIILRNQKNGLLLQMSTRREKSKPQTNRQLVTLNKAEQETKVNQRQEKLADFLIDVAKYIFTGVIITSLFNDMQDKTILYVVGMFIVVISLTIGLVLTSKRKDH